MVKKLEFGSAHEYLNIPRPARNYIPEWYKKAEKFIGKKPSLDKNSPLGQITIKACTPFLESYTTGYMIELWQDLEVKQNSDGTWLHWRVLPDVASSRDTTVHQGLPNPSGHSSQAFAWKMPFCFKTPKGYSLLITHPLNHFDLPFTTLSGIVDADEGINEGNLPVFFSNTFEGIIPAGTPIAQIIPFKRDDWQVKRNQELVEMGKKNEWLSLRVVAGFYKSTMWKKKNYN